MLSEKTETQRSGVDSQSYQARKWLSEESNLPLPSPRPGPGGPGTPATPPPRPRPAPAFADTLGPAPREPATRGAGRGGDGSRRLEEVSGPPLVHPRRPPPVLPRGRAMEAVPPLYRVAGAAGPQGDEDRLGVPDGPGAPVSGDGSVRGGARTGSAGGGSPRRGGGGEAPPPGRAVAAGTGSGAVRCDPRGPQPGCDVHAVRAPQLDELVGAYPNYNEEEEERRYYRRKRLGVVKNVLAASAGGMLTYAVYLGRRPAAPEPAASPRPPFPAPVRERETLGAGWLPFLFHFLLCRARSCCSCGLTTWRWGQVQCSGFPGSTFGSAWPGSGRPGRVCRLPDLEGWTCVWGKGGGGCGEGLDSSGRRCHGLSGRLAQSGHPSRSSWALESGTPLVTGAASKLAHRQASVPLPRELGCPLCARPLPPRPPADAADPALR